MINFRGFSRKRNVSRKKFVLHVLPTFIFRIISYQLFSPICPGIHRVQWKLSLGRKDVILHFLPILSKYTKLASHLASVLFTIFIKTLNLHKNPRSIRYIYSPLLSNIIRFYLQLNFLSRATVFRKDGPRDKRRGRIKERMIFREDKIKELQKIRTVLETFRRRKGTRK